MKQQKRKFLILALASVLGAATLGGGVMSAMADTTDAPALATYSVGDVFTTSSGASDTTGTYLGFNMQNGGTITLSQRSLAWKWFAEKGVASYLNFELTFADANFKEISVILETAAVTANKDNKAVNTLKFTNVDGTVYASVNDADPATEGVAVDVLPDGTTEKKIKVSVNETWAAGETDTYGKYNVVVNDGADKTVGTFENVGATYGKYASSTSTKPLTPFKITVTC